jgi:hypothetical protein
MKSIHAISTILAVWGSASSGVMANYASPPVRAVRFDDKSTGGVREKIAGRARPAQSAPGMPNLLAAALLQGGSRTDRRLR